MRCISRVSPLTRFSLSLVSYLYRPLARMGLSRYIRAGVTVRAIGHEMIVPTIGVALPPDLATRLPERDHELEDVAGDRVLRSAHGGFRGPRPAPAVRRVWRRPREEPLQKRAILFIDDARVSPVRLRVVRERPAQRDRPALFAQQPQHAEIRAGRPEKPLCGSAGRPEIPEKHHGREVLAHHSEVPLDHGRVYFLRHYHVARGASTVSENVCLQVRLKICGQSQAGPRLGRRGSAFVTVASKVSRDHLTELKGAGSRPSIASGL